ncbi:YdeI/OmpD-associated family protein [Cohnella mopanensis]|uniref:YdeI/OmpD-associated family protein n=1 Tax=Cohnella mopanensis TaxID=2911966 RepID=UPI001EF9000D|nr:YdeI/OmpD-associated family protein [Cohnella mopanensis]
MDEALAKKLRVSATSKMAIMGPPEGYLERIGKTADGTKLREGERGTYDYVQLFAMNVAEVEKWAPIALRAVKTDGLLWLCYPKGTSKLKTDLNRDRGWSVVHEAGWEGVALISVDEIWSAMRFRPMEAGAKVRVTPAERKAVNSETAETLEAPVDLRKALDANEQASMFFEKLAPSHKKEYVRWILEAKREETRVSRIQKAVEKLNDGLKRPSDKL